MLKRNSYHYSAMDCRLRCELFLLGNNREVMPTTIRAMLKGNSYYSALDYLL
jgi:hypothetical protein